MKLNPVYLKESKTSSRTVKTAVIILLFNGVLAAVAFLNLVVSSITKNLSLGERPV